VVKEEDIVGTPHISNHRVEIRSSIGIVYVMESGGQTSKDWALYRDSYLGYESHQSEREKKRF